MKRIAICAFLFITLISAAPKQRKRVNYDPGLPILGTKLRALPNGKGKEVAESGCLPCHSADLIVQQRLTEKQWIATVDKMVRWGAIVSDEEKPELIRYLTSHFGPENRFTPTKTRPVGY